MDSLYLLLPMSVLLVLALIGVFAWAVNAGQFEDLEREGWRIVEGAGVEGARAEASGAEAQGEAAPRP
jgi:cbb3-type cytochrome oxidase maturation protein